MMSNSACDCPRAIVLARERLLRTHSPSGGTRPPGMRFSRRKTRSTLANWRSPVRLRLSQSHAEDRPLLRVPFRAGTTHVVQLGPVAVADIEKQVLHDAGKVGDCLDRVVGKYGPPRIAR